jgi:hypothetical protein
MLETDDPDLVKLAHSDASRILSVLAYLLIHRKLTAVFGNYLNGAMVARRPDTYDSARP